jgi:TonB family protein
MFDFVMSGNQERRPAKRIIASWMISCLAHFTAILLLIAYPELLNRGVYSFSTILQPKVNDEDQNWRPVTVLSSKMTMPSAETLKNLFSDSEKKGPGAKPIRIRLHDLNVLLSDHPAKPIARPEVGNSPPPPPDNEGASQVPVSPKPETGSSGSLAGNQNNGNGGNQGTGSLPSLGSVPKPAVIVTNVAPIKIPDPIVTHPDIPAGVAKSPNTSAGGGSTVRSPDITVETDSKGFPIGEYADLIQALVQEKYREGILIPSYRVEFKGRTTVGFSIDKNGTTLNLKILTGSGNTLLDIAALNAVQKCNLPALPKGFPEDHVNMRFIFFYNMH